MTFGKGIAIAAALVVAFALGVWTAPYFTDITDRTASVATPSPDEQPASAVAKRRPARAEREGRAAREAERREATVRLAASEPEVHRQLKPVLNMGTNVQMAAEGFADAEQFASVAHAARNTGVPFMVLKHRVLNEGKSLRAAIAESKPDVDAAQEARRAREAAREDLAGVTVRS